MKYTKVLLTKKLIDNKYLIMKLKMHYDKEISGYHSEY